MDISYGAEETSELLTQMPNEDQAFLLYFIMGTYFGPALKHETVKKSALQRVAECLPPYTSDQLANTYIKAAEVQRIYYHVLRKADRALSVNLPVLNRFLEGNIHTQIQERYIWYPQFPDLFPSTLHRHSRSNEGCRIIENVIFISSPDVHYIEPANAERFTRLTGLDSFVLSWDAATMCTSTYGGGSYNASRRNTKCIGGITDTENHFHDIRVVTSFNSVAQNAAPMSLNGSNPVEEEEFEPAVIFLPYRPNLNEWQNIIAATGSGFGLTGCAAKGQTGQVIGHMDIGQCESSYIFRVSLPGVKRDAREFSCVVEADGGVVIKGVTTTGEKRVCRHSQMFQMLTQNLCPPGDFSISFKLPGPVDPLRFSGNFGTNGILEGFVMKLKHKKTVKKKKHVRFVSTLISCLTGCILVCFFGMFLGFFGY